MNVDGVKGWFPIVVLSIIVLVVLFVVNIFQLGSLLIVLLGALILAIILLLFIRAGVHIVPEYERLVIFRLGRSVGTRGPGLVFVSPLVENWVSVDMRERNHEISHETCITQDNAKIDVDFIYFWKIVNPVWSYIQVQGLEESLKRLATGRLRDVIGGFQLDEVLNQRDRIDEEFRDKLEEVSETWGVTVTRVEIREILPPKDIQDAMHQQLAAERHRRAKMLESTGDRDSAIQRAEGQARALELLRHAAKELDPKTLQLKYLEALTDLGKSSSTKFVFPLEFTQFLKPFLAGQGAISENLDLSDNISRDEFNAFIKVLWSKLEKEGRAGNINSSKQDDS